MIYLKQKIFLFVFQKFCVFVVYMEMIMVLFSKCACSGPQNTTVMQMNG